MAQAWLLWSALAFVGGAVAAGVSLDGTSGEAQPFGGVFTSREPDAPLVVRVENDGSAELFAVLRVMVDGREVEREELRVPPGVREVGFATRPASSFVTRVDFTTLSGTARGSTSQSADPRECGRSEQLVVEFEVEAERNGISLGRGGTSCR